MGLLDYQEGWWGRELRSFLSTSESSSHMAWTLLGEQMGLSIQDGMNSSVTAQGNLAQLPVPVAGRDKPVL